MGLRNFKKKLKHVDFKVVSDDLDCWFVKLITLSFVKLASPGFKVRLGAIFNV